MPPGKNRATVRLPLITRKRTAVSKFLYETRFILNGSIIHHNLKKIQYFFFCITYVAVP